MTALTTWSTMPELDLLAVPELAALVTELGHVSCTCPHPADVHPVEVLRMAPDRQVLGYRLGRCPVAYCRCRGGRP